MFDLLSSSQEHIAIAFTGGVASSHSLFKHQNNHLPIQQCWHTIEQETTTMRQKIICLVVLAITASLTIFYATTFSANISNSKFADHLLSYTSLHPQHNTTVEPIDNHKELPAAEPQEKPWTFTYPRDARNFGLSEAQCTTAFPALYADLARATTHRKRTQSISLSELDTAWRGDGIVRAMIYSNQLYIIEARGIWDSNHRPRALASLHALHRAIIAYPDILPNIEFTMTDHDSANMADQPPHVTWAYSREASNEALWLMPDFNFWSWPDVNLRSYGEFQTLLAAREEDFADRIPKIVWRGSVDVAARDVRANLLKYSHGKSWSDVRALDWRNQTDIREHLIAMEQHCDYMFVAQTEGNTYSGRLKYLLNCGSVVVSHELGFVEHFSHLLEAGGPEQNYVQVKRDFKDLEKKLEGFLDGQKGMESARKVAEQSKRTFRERYLTPAAETCYWRALIRAWKEVQGFEVEFWKEVEVEGSDGKKKMVRRPRGVPFESYV